MATNCNCECFNDVYNINNTAYNVDSDSWVNSYLCDFMTAVEYNTAEKAVNNPAGVSQGFSLHNGGKKAVVYLINEADGSNSRSKMVLIDLSTYTIIDSVERDTATDNTAARLNHCNGATSYTTGGKDYSVTVHGHYAFITEITDSISNVTTSRELYIMVDGKPTEYTGATSITFDSLTGYWYVLGGGKVYRSTAVNYTDVPDTYEFIVDTGVYTSGIGGIEKLKRQGCMIVNQSATVRDGYLYMNISAPPMIVVFNLDSERGAVGELIAVHSLDEFATGYTGLENECINWSDYLGCWVVNTNGRYLDEVSIETGATGKAERVYNHITLWAVGNTVGINTPQAYSTTAGKFTIQAGAARYIYCTLDPDIMHDGYKIGEQIRHLGYENSPFRSITQAFSYSTFLQTASAHQTVAIVVNGDFNSYLRSSDSLLTVQHNATIRLTNGSTLPRLNLRPNTKLSIDTTNDSAVGFVPQFTLHRGSQLFALNVHTGNIDMRAGSTLTGNNFGTCTLNASGQNVISIGRGGTFTGKVYGSLALIGGNCNNLTFENCVNLYNITTGGTI